MSELQSLHDQERIPIYRSVGLSSPDDIHLDCPGESWSYREGAAFAFGNENIKHGSLYMLVATVPREAVDWDKAFWLSFEYSDECELPIHDQSKIEMVDVIKFRG